MDKLSPEIFNTEADNITKLASLFPSAVKDGEVDFEALREELGEFKEVSSEKYELTWAGKQAAKKLSQTDVPGRTLKYVPEDSKDAETTQNLYIEGDNLEVLKLLRQNYYGAVKMIYIDPPYNTGNDFVYRDNFSMSAAESNEAEGETINGERMVVNQKTGNRYHANWLNMMYPRLRVAKDLLSDDGVIFISIDDNELGNLIKLCDNILNEGNHLGTFIWKRRQMVDSRTKTGVSEDHEYLLCYLKSQGRIRGKETDMSKYSNPDNDPNGDWMSADMTGLATASQRPNLHYDIVNPTTGIIYKCPPTGWRYEKSRMQELIDNGEVIFPKDLTGRPRRKKYAKDLTGEYAGFSTVLNTIYNTQATRELRTIFDEQEYFDFPKPVELIKLFIEQGTTNSNNDIILDFFSGSATTAHAVMQLNAEDGGNRKFVMVQYPETCDEKSEAAKAGYANICEIGKERIRRAGEKIKAEIENSNSQLKLGEEPKQVPDIGFRVFRTADTNIRWTHEALRDGQIDWDESLLSDKDKLDFMPGYTDIDVVYEVMLRQRDIPLSAKTEKLDIGHRTYMFADAYVVCLDESVSTELVEALAGVEPTPIKYVLRDSAFDDNISLKDETIRRLEAYIARNSGEQKKAYTVEFI